VVVIPRRLRPPQEPSSASSQFLRPARDCQGVPLSTVLNSKSSLEWRHMSLCAGP